MNAEDIKTIYLTPTGQSAEQIFDMVREFVQSGKIGLIIFDSLTAIAPQQTNEESFEKKDMGGLAKPLADFVKRCTGLFNKYKTTFIGINGNIMNISGYGNPETTAGGTYWKRACSLRLKVKKGTQLKVFWVGEKPTYQAQRYSYIKDTELIAGCYDNEGNKVWIKAEYLRSVTPLKSPCAAERKKFIDSYIKRNADSIVLKMAMGGN